MQQEALSDQTTNLELIDYLTGFITEERRQKFVANLAWRTRHITIALEDIYQPHNASAVLRSCDCFGIQDVHIIENHNKYEVNPDVALGASKWLTLFKYDSPAGNTIDCITRLKNDGYRVYATSPHKDDVTPETMPLDQKACLLFGTELEGLTSTAKEMADGFVKIPMFGFTESLNISVSAAILMQTLSTRLRSSNVPWQLTSADRNAIMLQWLKKSVKKSDLLIRDFLQKNHPC